MNIKDEIRLEAEIKALTRKISLCTKAYHSPTFTASMVISGTEETSKDGQIIQQKFHEVLEFSSNDREGKIFFEAYANNLCGKRAKLYVELERCKQTTPQQ